MYVVCVINDAGGVFEEELPAVITIVSGETFSTFDIAVSNDASFVTGSQFTITLNNAQLQTGQSKACDYIARIYDWGLGFLIVSRSRCSSRFIIT